MISKPLKGSLLVLLALTISGCATKSTNDKKSLISDDKISVKRSILKSTGKQNSDIVRQEEETQNGNDFSSLKIQDLGGITRLKEDAKKSPALSGAPITFSADEISIKEFTSRVFDELLGLNYVVAPGLAASNDKITLNISTEIPRTDFYKVVIKTLEESSIRALRKDNILYLSKTTSSDQKNSIAIGIGNQEIDIPQMSGAITQIVPYVYSSSRNITSIMKKLSTAQVTVNSLQKLIILEGDRTEILRAMKIVNMLDVPRAYGRQIRLIEFAHISPIEGIKQIEKLLVEDGMEVSQAGDASFVPIPRINAFVAYAASEKIIDRITFWANKIDVPIAGDERQYFIYKPKYAKAEDMLESISTLLLGQTNTPNSSSNSNSGSDGADSRNRGSVSSEGPIRFSLDKQQNALIFYTTTDEYRLVESLMEKMDVLPGQVILDVTILEVTLSDSVSSGIDWVYQNTGLEPSSGPLTNFTGSPSSIVGTVLSGNWQANLNWNSTKSDSRVLSRPYLIVRDGESATISSGDQVPIITQTVQNVGDNNSVSNSVQYRSTGVNVTITPIINSQGVISLSVSMSVSNASANNLGGSSSPTITNRSITTEILSGDGQTVALGGLIQQTKDNKGNSIPGLSTLPILGNLFKTKDDAVGRTELVMLITTKVINNSSEVDEFSEAMTELYSTPITIK
ncbi:secretin N-terminal domain-containing protein [Pseudoalteromonas sp. Z9A5]|uniref:secretin N-terminal domain-containing protein n=1 Tax=Pseudoalteromonas sp. Z9A5 TaxID=2686355 RepID=UPI0014088AEF|nr:secretin N-terminal domain-containing protein [Pseudoalteromonas sp. Z9A5]